MSELPTIPSRPERARPVDEKSSNSTPIVPRRPSNRPSTSRNASSTEITGQTTNAEKSDTDLTAVDGQSNEINTENKIVSEEINEENDQIRGSVVKSESSVESNNDNIDSDSAVVESKSAVVEPKPAVVDFKETEVDPNPRNIDVESAAIDGQSSAADGQSNIDFEPADIKSQSDVDFKSAEPKSTAGESTVDSQPTVDLKSDAEPANTSVDSQSPVVESAKNSESSDNQSNETFESAKTDKSFGESKTSIVDKKETIDSETKQSMASNEKTMASNDKTDESVNSIHSISSTNQAEVSVENANIEPKRNLSPNDKDSDIDFDFSTDAGPSSALRNVSKDRLPIKSDQNDSKSPINALKFSAKSQSINKEISGSETATLENQSKASNLPIVPQRPRGLKIDDKSPKSSQDANLESSDIKRSTTISHDSDIAKPINAEKTESETSVVSPRNEKTNINNDNSTEEAKPTGKIPPAIPTRPRKAATFVPTNDAPPKPKTKPIINSKIGALRASLFSDLNSALAKGAPAVATSVPAPIPQDETKTLGGAGPTFTSTTSRRPRAPQGRRLPTQATNSWDVVVTEVWELRNVEDSSHLPLSSYSSSSSPPPPLIDTKKDNDDTKQETGHVSGSNNNNNDIRALPALDTQMQPLELMSDISLATPKNRTVSDGFTSNTPVLDSTSTFSVLSDISAAPTPIIGDQQWNEIPKGQSNGNTNQ